MADNLTFLSWNVRGLGDPTKRSAVFNSMRNHMPAIVGLQETHLTKSTTGLLARSWIGSSFHSTHTTYSRGVSVLVHRSIPFVCITQKIDGEGRYVCLHCRIFAMECVVIVLYVPPPYSSTVFKQALLFAEREPHLPLIIMGDFNNVAHPYWDRLGPDPLLINSAPTMFGTMLKELSLTDVWRAKHPNLRAFSCHSSSHATMSRIDLVLTNNSLLSKIRRVEYLPRSVSDHSPLLASFSFSAGAVTGVRGWRLNAFWLPLLEGEVILQHLVEYFQLNNGTASKGIVWDAMKASLRGILIQQISRKKLKNRAYGDLVRRRVIETEAAYVRQLDSRSEMDWKAARGALQAYELETAENKRFFAKQFYFEEGERAGHMLATIARAQRGASFVTSLESSQGELVSDTLGILNIFQSYYKDLYMSGLRARSGQIEKYLETVPLLTLSAQDSEFLEAPLQLGELREAVNLLPSNKAPGNDGLPGEVYKKFGEVMLPELLQVFQEALEGGSLPESMREAVIVVIPKPGKDPVLPGSYRPISLLPVDIKIIAKALAIRLSKVIKTIIHSDQTGFIPSQSTATNIRRLYLNLQLPVDNPGERAVCSLDAAKAFDSVEWEFLWAVMLKMGFGPRFISSVQLLYAKPRARLRVNNELTEAFALGRGTRQGCPLSPLLFAIAIEPLAAAVRTHPGIVGFKRGGIEDRIALYADDVLLFLGDTGHSLQCVASIIKTYGQHAGVTINWNKSVLMPVDGQRVVIDKDEISLECAPTFKYLGITISNAIADFENLNLAPLMIRFRQKLDAWCKLPLSVVGRANLIKMVWMPQLLYLLNNSPIWLPHGFFYKVNRIFRDLIWRKGVARIKLQTLQRAKEDGGLAIPNPELYFLSAQLQHLRGWGIVEGSINTALIRHFLRSTYLFEALEAHRFRVNARSTPTLYLIHKIWWKARDLQRISGCTQVTSIWDTPWLPELACLEGFGRWKYKGIRNLRQIFKDGVLKQFSELRSEYDLPSSHFYKYLQLRHAVQAEMGDMGAARLQVINNPIVDMVGEVEASSGLISRLYKYLMAKEHERFPISTKNKWERDIGPIEEEQWQDILSRTPKLSLSEAHRLSQLYLLHRVYRTPAFLYDIGLRNSPLCARCKTHRADLLHMMWSCPRLGQFWTKVTQLISSLYQVEVQLTPYVCILGYVEDIQGTEPIKLAVARMLFMARKVIAQRWLQETPPTYREFVNKVNWLISMERPIYMKRGGGKKFEDLWAIWLDRSGLATAELTRDRYN